MVRFREGLFVFIIVATSLVITLFHLFSLPGDSSHIVLEELYYVPILIGAFSFGVKGAWFSFFWVSLLYLPFFREPWSVTLLDRINRILHLIFSGLFAALASYLIERERTLRTQLERNRYLSGLGQTAASIVHDLKNPLITVSGFSRRLLAGKGNLEEGLTTIIDCVSKMEQVVNDVLSFAKPFQLITREEDIRTVVEQAVESCRNKAEDGGVTLSYFLPPSSIPLNVDAVNLQRALINIIFNAIEASSPGSQVVISVTKEHQESVIKIRDQGVGMDKETLENIFLPFFSQKPQGTGLGMAIAQKVVEAHQGTISIKSAPNRGTEVTIKLPQ